MNELNIIEKKQKQGLQYNVALQMFCILYISIWSIFPSLQIGTTYRLLALACMGVWFVFAVQRNIKLDNYSLYTILFVIIVAAMIVWQNGMSGIFYPIAVYMLVLFFIINTFYKNRWNELADIHVILLVIFIVCNILTYREILLNPQITRSLVRDTEELYNFYKKGIGGYSLIYSQVCIFAVGLQWTISNFSKNKFKFIVGAVWIVTLTLLLFKAGYSIAIFTYCTSLIILFFYKRKNSTLAIVIAVTLLFVFLYSIVKFTWLQTFLLNLFDGTTVTKKINDLIESANDGVTEGSILVRMNAYINSLKSCLNYPIIGSLFTRTGGGHSAVLDTFANFGLFGGIIYTRTLIFEQFKDIKKGDNKKLIQTANACIVALMLVSTMDTISYQFIPAILIMVPLFMRDISAEKRAQKK